MKFALEQTVRLLAFAGIEGTVIGRSEYTAMQASYLVRYEPRAGVLREDWLNEDQLGAVAEAATRTTATTKGKKT
jgi:hypothetical protein